MHGLTRYEGAPVEMLRGATRRAFEDLVDLAIHEQVGCVIIAGDLYDGDRDDFNTAIFLQQRLRRLTEAGIACAILLGNHDAANEITRRLQLPDGSFVFSAQHPETRELPDLGLALHGRSYPTRAVTEDLAGDYPRPIDGLLNVGVLHTCLDGAPGHERYAPCSARQLFDFGYQYWALGHIHQQRLLTEGGVHVVFPGNLQGRHARELGPKGAVLVEYDAGAVLGVEHRSLDVVRWERAVVDAAGALTVDEILHHLDVEIDRARSQADGRPLALRVQIEGRTEAYDALVNDHERFDAQVRADFGADEQVWIERVELAVRRPGLDGQAEGEAIGAVRDTVARLRTDPAALDAVAQQLYPLIKALGPRRADFVDLTGISLDAAGVAALLPEIEDAILAGLEQGS
jgi:DNA repair exonuclease SbcCD nuclease subunit